MNSALAARGLTRHFGDVQAVNGLGLDVPEGCVFGFLGPNGAGKTTTIRMLLGLIAPDSGRVVLNGYDVSSQRRQALASVGSIVETPSLYPNLTGRENLRLCCRTHGGDPRSINQVSERVDIAYALDRRVGQYSLGMRQRLALARALLTRPRLLILDEPTNGLDPAGIAQFRVLLRTLPANEGTTVFLSSHLLAEIEQIVDQCTLMLRGRAVFSGELDALRGRLPAALVIKADRPERVQASLAARGLAATIHEGDGLRVTEPQTRKEQADLLASLVSEGHAIYEFRTEPVTLEQAFMTLTADQAP